MKFDDINVGDLVLCSNHFGLTYCVKEKFKTVCTLEYGTGEEVMYGGKMVPEVCTYKAVRYSQIKEVL